MTITEVGIIAGIVASIVLPCFAAVWGSLSARMMRIEKQLNGALSEYMTKDTCDALRNAQSAKRQDHGTGEKTCR